MQPVASLSSSTRAGLLALSAFLGGLLNGLLGTGGGMVLLFALGALLSPGRTKEAFVISSIGVLTFSAVSVFFYNRAGSIPPTILPRFALPAVVGALLGAYWLEKISTQWLRRIFALLVLYSGLKMLGVVP